MNLCSSGAINLFTIKRHIAVQKKSAGLDHIFFTLKCPMKSQNRAP